MSQSQCSSLYWYERDDASGSKPRQSMKPNSMLKKLKSLFCLQSAATSEESVSESSTDVTMQRRTDALRVAGLLSQSKIYGQRPYRDDFDAYAQPAHPEKKKVFNHADEKDLITFEECEKGCGVSDAAQWSRPSKSLPSANRTHPSTPSNSNDSFEDEEAGSCSSRASTPPLSPSSRSPPSPTTPLDGDSIGLEPSRPILTLKIPPISTPHPHSSSVARDAGVPKTTPGDVDAIRIRRVESLKREAETIEDAETRRLTEMAFLC